MIFNVNTLSGIGVYLKNMFFLDGKAIVNAEFAYYLKSYGWLLIIAILGATNLPKKLYEKCQKLRVIDWCLVVIEPIAMVALLLLCTAYLVDGSFNPFLYFRF